MDDDLDVKGAFDTLYDFLFNTNIKDLTASVASGYLKALTDWINSPMLPGSPSSPALPSFFQFFPSTLSPTDFGIFPIQNSEDKK